MSSSSALFLKSSSERCGLTSRQTLTPQRSTSYPAKLMFQIPSSKPLCSCVAGGYGNEGMGLSSVEKS